MSILKSIYKVRNRDSQTYDTLHPETEHSQVVDFGQGILSHLQSNVLASAISAMTSDSLFAKMMKLVLDASGVKYSMAQNGYICLGEFFGNLIIQWGMEANEHDIGSDGYGVNLHYPLSVAAILMITDIKVCKDGVVITQITEYDTTNVSLWASETGNANQKCRLGYVMFAR